MEERLIEFVKENKFLYNKKHSLYKCKALRDKKFKELSCKLKCPARKLKNRWRTLKDKFHKELKKEQNPCPHEVASKTWKWMDHLAFLRDVYAANHDMPTGVTKVEEGIDDNCALDTAIEEEELTDELSCDVNVAPSDTNTNFLDSICHIKLEKNTSSKSDDKVKGAREEMSEIITMAKKAITRSENSESAAQLFFGCLAKQTEEAQLSPMQFARLQLEMLQTFNRVVYET